MGIGATDPKGVLHLRQKAGTGGTKLVFEDASHNAAPGKFWFVNVEDGDFSINACTATDGSWCTSKPRLTLTSAGQTILGPNINVIKGSYDHYLSANGAFPSTDGTTNNWSANGAYWGSPMIHRSHQLGHSSGDFPHNAFGELLLQGTSHGPGGVNGYNKGISFVTWDGSEFSPPTIKMRVKENGNIGIGTTDPQAKLHAYDDTIDSLDILRLETRADSKDDYVGLTFKTLVGGNAESGYVDGPHAAIRAVNPS